MHNVLEHVEHTIDMDEGLDMPAKGWTNQRIGWTCFVLMLTFILLSFLGNGVLSYRKAEVRGNMVEYERYGRFKNSATLHFKADDNNGMAVIQIPQEYLQQFQLERITPEPDGQKMVDGNYVYTFLTKAPVHILLRGIPKKTGAIEARVKINDAQFRLAQFIFP